MSVWKRYGDEKPTQGKPCWFKVHRRKSVQLGEWEPGWRSNLTGWWRVHGILGPEAKPDDLWCYAVPPELPKET